MMQQTIIKYLDEKISEGEDLLKSCNPKEQGERDTIRGYIECCHELKEFIEEQFTEEF